MTRTMRARRALALGAAGLLAGAPALRDARAQAYPARPVRIVAPFPPSGGTDLLARVVAESLSQRWGQPVIVDNRPGGNATMGTDLVARAAANGYTLLLTASIHSVMPSLHRQLAFDPIRDFDAVALLTISPGILLVHPSLPVSSVQDLIAHAKARPGQLNYGSAGFGGSAHLAAELFKLRAGVDIRHIPYKGAAPALLDLLGGQVQLMFGNLAPSLPHVSSGRLRALGVTSAQRAASAPSLPTIAESGLADFEVSVWFGILGPRGLPKPLVDRVNADVAAILQQTNVKAQFEKLGYDPAQATPAEFGARVAGEVEKWRRLVREAKIAVE